MKDFIRRLWFAFILLLIGICVIAIGVKAYDSKIQSSIVETENKISSITEAQVKTHELANYYRENLIDEHSEAVITNLQKNWFNLDEKKMVLQDKLDKLKSDYESIKKNYLGSFKLTAYCPCVSCSEGWGEITSTGVSPKEGRTVAVDPNAIPYGTKLYISGVGYRVAEDCGGGIKQNKIDIYVSDHSRCYNSLFNQNSADVWIVD